MNVMRRLHAAVPAAGVAPCRRPHGPAHRPATQIPKLPDEVRRKRLLCSDVPSSDERLVKWLTVFW
jgi:hypothetical protein